MGSKTAVAVAAGADLSIAIVKFAAAAVSGSASLASEGIHSVVDTVDQLLLLLGQRLSEKPADKQHPFGYGKELYFWSTVVCTIILSLGGGGSFLEGLLRVIRRGGELRAVGWSYASLAFALVCESTSLAVGYHKLRKRHPGESLWRVFRRSKDPSILTVILEDSAAVVGVLIAFLGILLSQVFHDDVFDGIAAMCIGLLLITIAVLLIRESRSLVIGESADPSLVEKIQELLAADPCVNQVGGVLTMHFGPDQVLVNTQLEFRDGMTCPAHRSVARDSHRSESAIMTAHPETIGSTLSPLDHSPQRTAWWSILLRGLLAIVFGLIALSRPGAAATAFIIVFAVYALADGAMAFVQALWRGRAGLRWGWYLVEGLASVAAGVIALAYPAVTLLIIVLLVALRAIVLGLIEIVGAFAFRGFESRWLLGFTGVVSALFGIMLLANPLAGKLALIWVVGIYAIVFGVMLFGHGLQVFGVQHRQSPGLPRAAT